MNPSHLAAFAVLLIGLAMPVLGGYECTPGGGATPCPADVPVYAYFETDANCSGPVSQYWVSGQGLSPTDPAGALDVCHSSGSSTVKSSILDSSWMLSAGWESSTTCPEPDALNTQTLSFHFSYSRPYQCITNADGPYASQVLLLSAYDPIPSNSKGIFTRPDILAPPSPESCPTPSTCSGSPVTVETYRLESGNCSAPAESTYANTFTPGECYYHSPGIFVRTQCLYNGYVQYYYTGDGCDISYATTWSVNNCETGYLDGSCVAPDSPISFEPVVFPPPETPTPIATPTATPTATPISVPESTSTPIAAPHSEIPVSVPDSSTPISSSPTTGAPHTATPTSTDAPESTETPSNIVPTQSPVSSPVSSPDATPGTSPTSNAPPDSNPEPTGHAHHRSPFNAIIFAFIALALLQLLAPL